MYRPTFYRDHRTFFMKYVQNTFTKPQNTLFCLESCVNVKNTQIFQYHRQFFSWNISHLLKNVNPLYIKRTHSKFDPLENPHAHLLCSQTSTSCNQPTRWKTISNADVIQFSKAHWSLPFTTHSYPPMKEEIKLKKWYKKCLLSYRVETGQILVRRQQA